MNISIGNAVHHVVLINTAIHLGVVRTPHTIVRLPILILMVGVSLVMPIITATQMDTVSKTQCIVAHTMQLKINAPSVMITMSMCIVNASLYVILALHAIMMVNVIKTVVSKVITATQMEIVSKTQPIVRLPMVMVGVSLVMPIFTATLMEIVSETQTIVIFLILKVLGIVNLVLLDMEAIVTKVVSRIPKIVRKAGAMVVSDVTKDSRFTKASAFSLEKLKV